MRIIISPAKKMRRDTDALPPDRLGTPAFIERAEELAAWVRALPLDERKRLWACSDAIARQNHERFATLDLRHGLTPALLAYDGIQYSYMAPSVFEDGEFDWVQDHVRILSGLYGVLRPFDGVASYRLEMQAKAVVAGHANLYDYWGDALAREVMDGDDLLVNLASKEYSRAVERHLRPGETCITCVFGELVDARAGSAGVGASGSGSRVVQKGVYVKMARGEMVRYLASVHAESPEQLRGFAWSGYRFDPERSNATTYTFVR